MSDSTIVLFLVIVSLALVVANWFPAFQIFMENAILGLFSRFKKFVMSLVGRTTSP
jgi:hypothetical protein